MNTSTIKFDDLKRLIDKTSIKCKLVDCTAWHKVYKDTVFNEVLLYQSFDSVCLKVVEEPYILSTLWPDNKKSYFSFFLKTNSVYIFDKKDIASLMNYIDKKYAICLQIYESVNSEIETANRQYQEISCDTNMTFEKCHDWFLQKERELTNMIQDLSKIYNLC